MTVVIPLRVAPSMYEKLIGRAQAKGLAAAAYIRTLIAADGAKG